MSFFDHPNVKHVRFEQEIQGDGVVKQCVIIETDLSLDEHELNFDKEKHGNLLSFLSKMVRENERFERLFVRRSPETMSDFVND
jgi:hypothetical protein